MDVRAQDSQAGQSAIEVMIVLPLFLALIGLTLKVNQAIQVSLVNQQYARAQALRLAGNSPVFPELRFRLQAGTNDFANGTIDRMIIGVSDDIPSNTQGSFQPTATTQTINRTGKDTTSDPTQEEPLLRGNIRVRTNVALCTQFNGAITDDGGFSFCRSNL